MKNVNPCLDGLGGRTKWAKSCVDRYVLELTNKNSLQIYPIYTNLRVRTICASQKVQAQELVIDRKRENDYSKFNSKKGAYKA